jgi:hypothetical protein
MALAMASAAGPEMRTTLMPPTPGGVAAATIVSIVSITLPSNHRSYRNAEHQSEIS